MSLWFYGYEEPIYLILILSSILVNFFLTRQMTGRKKKCNENASKIELLGKGQADGIQKLLLITGLIFNLGLLFYFKYYNFFLDNIYSAIGQDWKWRNIFLPLGISFFTFQQLSYVIDCYKDEEGISYGFIEYAAYVSFFPQLVAGPIVMHTELIPQFGDRRKKDINYDNLARGLYGFALGLGKKVLIADTLSKVVTVGFADVSALNTASALVVMLAYTLQIYFDFSGYSDMALGMASMFNMELPINFNSPYKAKTIGEFWERWHMTLTRFFTQYVYIPLGGNRKGKIRTYVNRLVVFLLSGLWHGANWTFVLWGGLHGAFLTTEKIIHDITQRKHLLKKEAVQADTSTEAETGSAAKSVLLYRIWRLLTGSLTFLFVNLTWVIFRAVDIEEARLFLGRLISGGWSISEEILAPVDKLIEVRLMARIGFMGLFEQYSAIPLLGILILLLIAAFFLKNTQEKMSQDKYHLRRSLLTVFLLVWCIISLSDVSEFLYFNF